MSGLMYEAPWESITMTDAAQDIVEMVASADTPFILHRIEVTSDNITDVRARLRLVERTSTGSGGTALTEVPLQRRNTLAPDTAVSRMVTTPGSLGDIHGAFRWSLLVPYIHQPTPEVMLQVPAGERIALNLVAGAGQSETVSGTVIWEEI